MDGDENRGLPFRGPAMAFAWRCVTVRHSEWND